MNISKKVPKSFQYRWRLAQLQKEKRKCESFYDPLIADAKTDEEKESLIAEKMYEWEEIDLKISKHISIYLLNETERLLLPIPDLNDDKEKMWNRKRAYGILSNKGISELKSAIRNEYRERREASVTWMSLIIGLIGAATGLFAILLK